MKSTQAFETITREVSATVTGWTWLLTLGRAALASVTHPSISAAKNKYD
jgi:hypothetical protein